MNNIKTLALATTFTVLTGCQQTVVTDSNNTIVGSGILSEQARSIDTFTGVNLSGAFNATIDSCSDGIRLSGDDNILPLIQTEVSDQILYVFSDSNYESEELINVDICAGSLTSVAAAGANQVTVNVELADADLDISGASDLTAADITGENLDIELSGASSATISGASTSMNADLSGSSALDARQLQNDTTVLVATGASVARISANQISGSLSGASQLFINQDASISVLTNGASSITLTE